MGVTSIQWTDRSINPIRARDVDSGAVGHYCEKIAPGCANCYSSNFQKRFHMRPFPGVGRKPDNTELFLDKAKLVEVQRRKIPTKWFWCDMTDMFGDWVNLEWIEECLIAMDLTPWHTHQLLTKRPENISRMMTDASPLVCADNVRNNRPIRYRHNVWLGTSISDQRTADKAVPELLKCRDLSPVLFLSVEPLLGPIDLSAWKPFKPECFCQDSQTGCKPGRNDCPETGIDWVIVGGESGPNARRCRPEWIRSIVQQCKDAGVPCFVKQMGGVVVTRNDMVEDDFNSLNTGWPDPQVEYDIHGYREEYQGADCRVHLRDKKGGDPAEWPEDLRVRQFPNQ